MILVCGIPSEPPIAMVRAALEELGLAHVVVHQRRFMEVPIELDVVRGRARGHLGDLDIDEVTGIYARVMDWRLLPEASVSERCRLWHEALAAFIEIAPVRVMNRAAAMASNRSKPYQAQLIAEAGFFVPETLVTNDADEVRAFRDTHGEVVYKSISGVRSIVRLLDDASLARLPLVRSCPVQFQRFIRGTNVRVHVVAGTVFATRVDTEGVDYRYAARDGGRADLSPSTLPGDLSQRCVTLAASLGLELAGIDLLLAESGEAYCLEVNPSPAFSYFEAHTGQPIALAIAHALKG